MPTCNNIKTCLLLLLIAVVTSANINSGKETENLKCDLFPSECDVDPDASLTPSQIIRRHGYPSESHTVETKDGYLLTLHRIPGNKQGIKGRQPVFIQHGLLSSSADFVVTGNKSLGFILADIGYDVWLGNARGNTFSKAHVSLKRNDPKFWNFSFHEMGIYDVPAAIEYVSKITGKGGHIIYIGHSMGTTMYFVFSSLMPEFASKYIKAMVALAPVTDLRNILSPIRYLAPWISELDWLAKHMGLNEFLPSLKLIKFLSYDCEKMGERKDICENIIFAICGFDRDQFDEKRLPVILNNAPAGTSTKTLIHFGQIINDPRGFKCYDYGADNIKIYGTSLAPLYNITNIKTPMYLMYGLNDWLATPENVKRLAETLTNHPDLYEVPFKKFNHVDFLWAKDAPKLVYKALIKFMQRFRMD